MKIRIFLFLALILPIFTVSAFASEERYDCTVSFSKGEYVLSDNNGESVRSVSALPIFELVGNKRVYFDNVRIHEAVTLSGERNFFGNLFFDGDGGFTVSEGSVNFDNASVTLLGDDSYFRIDLGGIRLKDSVIRSEGECAVDLTSADSAITVLGDSDLCGREYGIISCGVVNLCEIEGDSYSGKDIFVKYTGEGSRLCDIVNSGSSYPRVRIFSRDGKEVPIHVISYVNEWHRSYREYRLDGESLRSAAGADILGYDFVGWRSVASAPGQIAESSMTLYAEYALSKPVVESKDISFTYDGEERVVSPSSIAHPLLPDGDLFYRWYRDGVLVSEGDKISVQNVSDSGKYKLEILFEYAGETVSCEPWEVNVHIEPKKLDLEYIDGEFKIKSGQDQAEENVEIMTVQKDGRIYAKTENPNYCLEFLPQISKNHSIKIGVILCTVGVILLLSFGGYFVFLSAEGDARVAAVKSRATRLKQEDAFSSEQALSSEDIETYFALDAAYADGLLSNGLAREMITKGGVVITDGRAKAEISVGELSAAFDNEEEIDINLLKERRLIPQDSYKIKITAEGKIDKPLKIFANEFDITAAKMIILSGGKAVRVKSRRKNCNIL